MIDKRRWINLMLTGLLLVLATGLYAQHAVVWGRVVNEKARPFHPGVNVAVKNSPLGAVTDERGYYYLSLKPGSYILRYSFTGYDPVIKNFILQARDSLRIDVAITRHTMLDTVEIVSRRDNFDGLIRVKPLKLEMLPSASGDLVSEFIKRMPGVSSRNEMSSQYNVRGGNFDENLVYVNGIEIHRPVLIRSGQQEGLPFVNSDLVKNIAFSAGGFAASYGDKMSSVLDISYKDPEDFAGSARAGLLGGSLHLQGATDNKKWRYLLGLRYKSNAYLLNSLDTKGEYNSSFTDVQSLVLYSPDPYWTISLLGNFNVNNYRMIPADRETNFGSVFEALRFKVYFEGQEVDRFASYLGSLKAEKKKGDLHSSYALSAYRTIESETFDVLGQYWLDVLENDLGKDDFGEVAFNKGVGSFLNHGRNTLDASIVDAQYRSSWNKTLSWGLNWRHDAISDRMSEWHLLDSAGYSLPHPKDNPGLLLPGYSRPNVIELQDVIKAHNEDFQSNRFSGFVQKHWHFEPRDIGPESDLVMGLRFNYWDFSREWIASPRANFSIKPYHNSAYSFRVATGLYAQPPFYREMRYFDGSINPGIKAQKSWHVVAGTEYEFDAWGRPFRLTAEAYYKYLWDVIPYEVNDVRIRYFAENNAVGYATGIDVKLNGEFVPDAESWVGLSLMQTREDILDDYYYEYYNQAGEKIVPGITLDNVPVDSNRIEPGFISRPTDQRFSFNLFFQDYIPGYPTYKVHLNLVFATGLPYGPPTHLRYQQTRRYPPYRRVDIGFSKQLIGSHSRLRANNPFRHFSSMWVSLEVFNLLQISNTVSYIWIQDVENRYYSVPNYLTPRRINLVLSVKF